MLLLESNGKHTLENLGYLCKRPSYDKRFVERQKIISSLGAKYFKHKSIKFIPSSDIKDKQILTTTARRYVGILIIENTEYLTYYISKNHDYKYVHSVAYDIRKERKYRNVIVFTEDINKININDFVFGLDKLYIIPTTEENIHVLNNINKIDYYSMFLKLYKEKVYLSEYDFCEYNTNSNKFIFTIPLIDTEKLATIKYFMLENRGKKVEIVYSKNISMLVIGRFEKASYVPVDYTKYIKEEFNVYE